MALTSYMTSAEYTHLDVALRSYWPVLEALEADMAAFVPKSVDDFAEARTAEIQRLQVLNPDQSEAQLAAFVDRQARYWADAGFQFMRTFDQRYRTLYVTVVLVSHALAEAMINAILGLGLANLDAQDLFPLLDRAAFKMKWLVAPKAYDPSYAFPEGTALHETLVALSRERNDLTHQKIELVVDGRRVLEGTQVTRRNYSDGMRWLRRFFSLPYDLAVFASMIEKGHRPPLLFDRTPVQQATEHVEALSTDVPRMSF